MKKIAMLEKQLKRYAEKNDSLEIEVQQWKKKCGDKEHRLYVEYDQEFTIQNLKDQVDILTRQLHQVEKVRSDSARKEEISDAEAATFAELKASWTHRESLYTQQLATLRQAAMVLEEENVRLQAALDAETTAKLALKEREGAYIIMMKSMEAELEKSAQAIRNMEDRLDLEERHRADGDPDVLNELYLKIEVLENETQNLKDELSLLEEERDKWTQISKEAAPMSPKKTNFPPRSSSAVDLLDKLPRGGTLEVELLKTKIAEKKVSEIERLRSENSFLVKQLVATLDSVSRLS
ncbi:hypothetical protein HK101_006665 [Irineochytrium annulatum]|nr:hypothetical protein HK101_006665 [Irineochytrium annulatum]